MCATIRSQGAIAKHVAHLGHSAVSLRARDLCGRSGRDVDVPDAGIIPGEALPACQQILGYGFCCTEHVGKQNKGALS